MNTETQREMKTGLYEKEAILELSRNLLWQSVVNLIPHTGFQPTVEWVRNKLPWVSYEEAGQTIEDLKAHGFLRKDPQGKWLEVIVDFHKYLNDFELIESQFIVSNEVAGMIQESALSNIYQAFVLSSEDKFLNWAEKVNAATEEFRRTSEVMNPEERVRLYAVTINASDATQIKKGAN